MTCTIHFMNILGLDRQSVMDHKNMVYRCKTKLMTSEDQNISDSCQARHRVNRHMHRITRAVANHS